VARSRLALNFPILPVERNIEFTAAHVVIADGQAVRSEGDGQPATFCLAVGIMKLAVVERERSFQLACVNVAVPGRGGRTAPLFDAKLRRRPWQTR